MNLGHLHILLADDDKDESFLFKEALGELQLSTSLTNVNDGQLLMQKLFNKKTRLPDVLFLDLNMPRKNGFECPHEIKQDERLKHIKVIIFSTSVPEIVADLLFESGAHYYVHKPTEFSDLKKVILSGAYFSCARKY